MGRDIRWGLSLGLFFTTAFSLMAFAVLAATGTRELAARGTGIGELLLIYYGGGIVGGMLLGLLRPLTRRRTGAAAVGILATIPASFAVGVAGFGTPSSWPQGTAIGIVLTAVILGGGGGWLYWTPRQ